MTVAYIASSFSLKERVQRVYEACKAAGIDAPDVWWDESREQADLKQIDVPDERWYKLGKVQDRADRHWENVRESDVFILVCPPDGTKKFNGANIELGYAFAHDLDVYAFGRVERSAMYIAPDRKPVTQVATLEELIEEIGDGQVGPIIFSNPTARDQLVETGEVVTFRTRTRTTGETWWTDERGGEKRGDVTVEWIKDVCPHGTGLALDPYVGRSGFDSIADWQGAIRALHGGMPAEGELYRVTEGHDA